MAIRANCRSGGTNLRVGFVELVAQQDEDGAPRRQFERSWPILDHLKNENADSLFAWIGECIVTVLGDSQKESSSALDTSTAIPMGITFSFPMDQHSLADATLRSMGKGFAIRDGTDLASSLLKGYERARAATTPELPPIKIVAITNDSVSTLISFKYSFLETATQKAAMGLIVGTGCNATVPLKLSCLHAQKRQQKVKMHASDTVDDKELKIAVNTEWSINGSVAPLRELGLVTPWDTKLDQTSGLKGFQPLEYMTAGRYLGELGRIIFLDYLKTASGDDAGTWSDSALPPALLQNYALDTTWLSRYRPPEGPLLEQLEAKFPPASDGTFRWTEEAAEALYHIAKAIEVRAAGIVAAAVVGLLRLTGEIGPAAGGCSEPRVLGVGYTGGCIANFQDYLRDTSRFLDEILRLDFGERPPVRVVLTPCHDGGIIGAGILCAAASL